MKLDVGGLGSIKMVVVSAVILLGVLFIALSLSRRDSKYYHCLSRLISPVSQFFLPAYSADPSPVSESFNPKQMGAAWKWYQLNLIAVDQSQQGLRIDSVAESVWYHNLRGPMLYRYFQGNGELSVTVNTRKSSDHKSYPDADWQFAGIIFRDPASDAWFATENYVFNVIGFRQRALQVEIKSTRDGISDVAAVNWQTGDAELLVKRNGDVFTLMARPLNHQSWQVIGEYSRPDLPSLLQVGIIVYSYSEGRQSFDLNATFNNLQIRSL